MSYITKKKKPNQQPRKRNTKRNAAFKNRTPKPTEKGMTLHSVQEEIELLPFLLKTLSTRSRNSVKSILARGQVSVNDKVITQYNHPLKAGQTVGIISNQEAIKKSNLIGIEIIHEDDDLIVINKDAGLLSVAASDPTEMTVYTQLSDYVKMTHPNNRIFVVHRLDRDTSGVMLYAKSEEMKEALQEDWNTRVKERLYTALVEDVVENDQGTVSSWLKENVAMKVYSSPVDNGGKLAITHYRKVLGNSNYTLLEVELETGRKNQIRVHLQDIGHPIVGDKKYGSESNPMKRLGLHATTLVLVHPKTNKLVRYTAPAPNAFLRLVK